MPANQTFTPARAAKQVGIPGSTLRHWSKVYAEFLSDVSNPEPGTQRAFTGNDVETLRAIAQLRANGIGQDEIIARLRENPTTGQQEPLQSPTTGLDVPTRANMYPAPLESILAVSVGKVDAMSDKLEALDRRLEGMASKDESRRNLILAFIAGVVLVVAIVLLVVLAWFMVPR